MKKVFVLIGVLVGLFTLGIGFAGGEQALAKDSDFVIKDGVLVEYKGSGGNVVIPDGVTEIKNTVFFRNTKITSVVIPDSVTKIGFNAFGECTNLTRVELPDTIIELPGYAFNGCTSLTTIDLKNVKIIGSRAFAHCESLSKINLGRVVEIKSNAFEYCKKLAHVDLTSLVSWEGNVFWLSGLTTFTGLDCLETPSSAALSLTPFEEQFQAGKETNRMLIKNGILLMAGNCTGEVIVPETVTKIASGAFKNQAMRSIVIPKTVNFVGSGAFSDCINLTSVRLEDSITLGEGLVFNGCTNLRNVRLPEGLTVIGERMFYGCKRLYNLTIPKSVKDFGVYTMIRCKGLRYITIDSSISESTCRTLLSELSQSGSKPIIYTDVNNLDSKVKSMIEAKFLLLNIRLQASDLSMSVGKSYELRMIGNAKCDSWTSSNPTVATVNYYGQVKAVRTGTAIITAEIYGKEYQCTVEVK